MGLLSAGMDIYAGNQQKQAGQDVITMANSAFSQSDPFAANRAYEGNQLLNLQNNPSSFLKDPMYQASLNQGLTGVERMMAAQGFLGSGNEATALMQFGQTNAWDMMMQQQAFLGQTSGALWQPNFSAAADLYKSGTDTKVAGQQQKSSGIGGIIGSALSFFGL